MRNVKNIAHPVTPYGKEYRRKEVLAMHPSVQRQVFLDYHFMRHYDQTRLWNNPAGTVSEWIETLH